MEYHRLYQMMDYQARIDAEMDFAFTGWCKCEDWMYERDEDGWHTCTICGNRISDEEFDERFPIPF